MGWVNLAKEMNRHQVVRFHGLGENTEKLMKYLVSEKGFRATNYVKCKVRCLQVFGDSSHCSNERYIYIYIY